jgi:hypothetical protein
MPAPDPYEPGGPGFMAALVDDAAAADARRWRNLLLLLAESSTPIGRSMAAEANRPDEP